MSKQAEEVLLSDVGIALKQSYVAEFEEKFAQLVSKAAERLEHEKGVCYIFKGIEWNAMPKEEEDLMIASVCEWLTQCRLHDFSYIRLPHGDFSGFGWSGSWHNPWKLGVKADLVYSEPSKQ